MISSMANRNSKAFYALGFLLVVLMMQRADATEFRVGGTNGWTVPTDPKALSLNQWAEMHRFRIGDTLCKLIALYGSVLCISRFNVFFAMNLGLVFCYEFGACLCKERPTSLKKF